MRSARRSTPSSAGRGSCGRSRRSGRGPTRSRSSSETRCRSCGWSKTCSTWRASSAASCGSKIDAVSLGRGRAGGDRRGRAGRGGQADRDRTRCSRRTLPHGQRRQRSAAAGGLEPAVERGQVHRRRRTPASRGGASTARNVRLVGARHRSGHRAGIPALRVRSVPPGGRLGEPPPRRPRSRAGAGAADRRAARRNGRRRERRRRSRDRLFWVQSARGAGLERRHGRLSRPRAIRSRSRASRFCIVDDENDAREMLVAMLENFGATVRAVASADEALEHAQAAACSSPTCSCPTSGWPTPTGSR